MMVRYNPYPEWTLKNYLWRKRLVELHWKIDRELDVIHDESLAKFRTLARSTGQLTRVDRVRFP